MIKSLGSLRLNWWPGFLIENYGPLENWTICLLSETLLLLLPRNKVIIYPFSTIYSGNLLTLKFHSNITIDTTSPRKQHLEATPVKLLWKSRCVSLGQLPGQIKSRPSHQTPRLEWVFVDLWEDLRIGNMGPMSPPTTYPHLAGTDSAHCYSFRLHQGVFLHHPPAWSWNFIFSWP